jgi:proton-translocating NADH-quinone oxidoreductase chain N
MSAELWLCLLGIGLLGLDLALPDRRKHVVGYAALAGLVVGLVPASGTCAPPTAHPALFGGLYMADRFQTFFRLFAEVTAILVVLLSLDYLAHLRVDRGVYFALIVFGALAMVLLAGSNDLIMIYLSIEFLGIVSYVLAGYLLGTDKAHLNEIKGSNEAAIKYLIYGAVASAVMLYGFSLLYGLAGSTSLRAVAVAFATPGADLLKLVALAMAMVGLGFKISAVPFQQWAPDVYQGAPTPVAAFLAVGSKGAAFAVLARFLLLGLGGWQAQWAPLLSILAVASMFTGNLLALLQSNFKRMLGYSGVAHAGYLLVALVTNGPDLRGVQALLIYLLAYLLMTMGAFAVVVWYQRAGGSEEIEDFAGLAQREPLMAVALTLFLLALTGIPPTAGFVGKLHILLATVTPDYAWLGVVIVVNSVISLYYYWNLARLMWLREPRSRAPLRASFCAPAVVYVCATLTLLCGLQFGWLWELTRTPLSEFRAPAPTAVVRSR